MHTQGISTIICVQAGAEANLLAATMPLTNIMHACAHPLVATHSYEGLCTPAFPEDQKTKQLFDSSDLGGLFFIP